MKNRKMRTGVSQIRGKRRRQTDRQNALFQTLAATELQHDAATQCTHSIYLALWSLIALSSVALALRMPTACSSLLLSFPGVGFRPRPRPSALPTGFSGARMFHYRIAPRKVSPGRQFTGKNPPRPAAARVKRIFTGKLSAGRGLSGGGDDPIMGRLFMGSAIF